jgi:hypothetical protein
MARPRSAVSKFILSLGHEVSAKDVLARLKAKGMKSTESNVYRVRRLGRKSGTKPVSTPTRGPGRPSKVSVTISSSAESLLRAVAAEVGLGRALDILQAERAKVRVVLG